jgi:hypothetical protein
MPAEPRITPRSCRDTYTVTFSSLDDAQDEKSQRQSGKPRVLSVASRDCFVLEHLRTIGHIVYDAVPKAASAVRRALQVWSTSLLGSTRSQE